MCQLPLVAEVRNPFYDKFVSFFLPLARRRIGRFDGPELDFLRRCSLM
jgi:hypothetical protein